MQHLAQATPDTATTATATPAAAAAATSAAATADSVLPSIGARLWPGQGVRVPVWSQLRSSRIVHAGNQVDLSGIRGIALAPESNPTVWKSR